MTEQAYTVLQLLVRVQAGCGSGKGSSHCGRTVYFDFAACSSYLASSPGLPLGGKMGENAEGLVMTLQLLLFIEL